MKDNILPDINASLTLGERMQSKAKPIIAAREQNPVGVAAFFKRLNSQGEDRGLLI
jgi:hypothetical protein